MTFLDAALAVLEACGRPMTAAEIVDEARRRGLLHPAGKTPAASLSACLYLYVREHPDGLVVRVAEPGKARARSGSVRWAVRGRVAERAEEVAPTA
jgi:HB1/ASXL restriction endonuclease-like protein with HTH domain